MTGAAGAATGGTVDERGAGDRAQAIATLRERIARLGGLGAAARPARGEGLAHGTGRSALEAGSIAAAADGATRVDAPAGLEAAALRLGFVPERQPSGLAWVRRVSVDLGPWLDRAGAPSPAPPAGLIALAYGMAAPPASALREEDVVVLDIETLGLRGSGVVPFLVGLGVPDGRHLTVDQILLADIGAERALLTALLARLGGRRLLVTYNGRTFDLPVLRSRCIVARVAGEVLEARLHCDVLRPVRRLFRDRLGACTLRQAESGLLGFERTGDVTGAEAPSRYQQWLRGGDAMVLEGVVLHNQLDLCGTMVLAARLAAHVAGRLVEPVHPADRYRLAVHLEREAGAEVRDEVEGHYRAAVAAAADPWRRHAAHRLARRLSREGGVEQRGEAAALLTALWGSDPLDLRAARALAILEERRGSPAAALTVACQALEVCNRVGALRLARLRGAPRGGWSSDWERRRARLTLRLARRGGAAPAALPGIAC